VTPRASAVGAESRPDWRARLRLAVRIATAERALDLMLDRGVSPAFDGARADVIAAIDAALLAGVSQAEVDDELADLASAAEALYAEPSKECPGAAATARGVAHRDRSSMSSKHRTHAGGHPPTEFDRHA